MNYDVLANMEDDPHHDSRALSHHYKVQTAHELLWLQSMFNYMMAIYIPLCVAILIFSCLWSDISGEGGSFTNPNDWQTCFVQADYIYIPLNSTFAPIVNQVVAGIGGLKSTITSCVTNEATGGNYCNVFTNPDGFNCLIELSNVCLSGIQAPSVNVQVANVPLPSGHMLQSLSYVGIQTIIFASMGHASLSRALRHPSWLPSTITLLVWCVFAIFTYYTVNPFLPVPVQTNATVLTFLIYGGTYTKYNEYSNGNNDCKTGYTYMWAYLTLILCAALTVCIATVMAVYAEIVRYKSKNRKHYEPLTHTEVAVGLSLLSMVFYLIVAAAKIYTTNNALDAISDFNLTINEAGAEKLPLWFSSIWFPFAQPSLDIATVLYVASFMSVFRGYTVQSVSAFRLAFALSLVFAITSYPALSGCYAFYQYNNFQDFDHCYKYFLGQQTGYFGYPSEDQAKNYCKGFRLSVAGNTGLVVTMHCLTLACLIAFYKNSSRESQIFDPVDFEGLASAPLVPPHKIASHEKYSDEIQKPAAISNPIH